MTRWTDRLDAWLFPAETDGWLTVLRIGLGLQTILYAVSLQADWNYLFARHGHELVSSALAEALLSTESPFIPRLGWLTALSPRLGLSEWAVLSMAWWLLLGSGVALVGGILSRASAVVAWLIHLAAAKSAGFLSYGVDNFMTIGFFYLVFAPLTDRQRADQRWRKSRLRDRSATGRIRGGEQLLGFWRRVLQLHLCLIYFFGGLSKCLGSGWWNGSSVWRALIRPPFNVFDPHIVVKWKYIFPFAGIGVALLELSYPFFIWRRSTRVIWLLAICGMHVAIGVSMGLYLFALVMIVLNLAAFAPEHALSGGAALFRSLRRIRTIQRSPK